MDAGKTTAACGIVRRLLASGLRVGGAKLTGVGRYRDILQLKDAGADAVFDFVDAGLPSIICPLDEMARALGHVFSLVEEAHFDVLVVEAGASPLEPYTRGCRRRRPRRALPDRPVRVRSVRGARSPGGLRDHAGPRERTSGQHRRGDRARRAAHRDPDAEHDGACVQQRARQGARRGAHRQAFVARKRLDRCGRARSA